MHEIMFLLSLFPFYCLGAVPTGMLVAGWHGIDITKVGSGNVGATNVGRAAGRKAGAITLALDVLKGFLAVVAAWITTEEPGFHAAAGIAAVFGHCFSFPHRLKGGKGVATSLGVILALSPLTASVAIPVFAGIFAVCRIVSLSSVAAALAAPVFALLIGVDDHISAAASVIALLVVFRHKDNLRRLIEGQEKKFSFGSS